MELEKGGGGGRRQFQAQKRVKKSQYLKQGAMTLPRFVVVVVVLAVVAVVVIIV